MFVANEFYITLLFYGVFVMIECLCVGLGGFIGSVCRYLMYLIPVTNKTNFPFVTLLINVLGAFALGMIVALTQNKNIDPRIMLMLKIGICRGFTTFSTFAFETFDMLQRGEVFNTLAYATGSTLFCVGAIFAAKAIAG